MEDISSIFEEILSSDEKRKQLKQLASMLGIDTEADFDMSSLNNLFNSDTDDSSEDDNTDKSGNQDFDFSQILKIKKLFSGSKESDKNIDLLTALKPHLNEKNQAKIDQSVKLLKLLALVPIFKDLGIFGGDFL